MVRVCGETAEAGAAVTAVAGGRATEALAKGAPVLVVYDSRHPESLAFAAGHEIPRLDVAAEHGQLWKTVRSSLPEGKVIGLTLRDWQTVAISALGALVINIVIAMNHRRDRYIAT